MVFIVQLSRTGVRERGSDSIICTLGLSFDSELLVSDGELALSLDAGMIKLLAKLDPI